MKRLVLSAFLSLAATAALAGGATNPPTINNLTAGGLPAVGGPIVLTPSPAGQSLIDAPGTPQYVIGSTPSQRWLVALGTSVAPITTPGPVVQISLDNAILNTSCGNNAANTECATGLFVSARGRDATTMVTSGGVFGAVSSATSVVAGESDAQAINAMGRIVSSGTGIGTGAYLEGRRENTGSRALGAEITAWNFTTSDCGVVYSGIGVCDGIWLTSRAKQATNKTSSALHIGLGDAFSTWTEGITLNSGSVSTLSFNDQSSSTNSLWIAGTHTNSLNIQATNSAAAITIPGNNAIGISLSGTNTYAFGSSVSAGLFGIGTVTPAGILHISGDRSAAAWTTNGFVLRQDDATYTDTTSSGTVALVNASRVGTPTLAASSATTYTDAVGLALNAPAAGTNVTLTNTWGLKNNGKSWLVGAVRADSTASVAGILTTNSGIQQTGNISAAAWLGAGLTLGIAAGTFTDTTSSGTVATQTMNFIGAPTLVASNATTYTSASTLVVNAPVASTNVTISNNWTARFNGNIQATGSIVNMSGLTTGTNADTICMATGGNLLIQAAACTISSMRFKNLIGPYKVGGALDTVARLDPIVFTMKPEAQSKSDPRRAEPQIGLSAENVAAIEPRCAIYEDDGVTPKSYRQECLIAVLVAGMQAQQRELSARR